MNKQTFSKTLRRIHKALCEYSEDVFQDMTPQKLFIVRVKYAVIMSAVYDLYFGSSQAQQLALMYFKSPDFSIHCDEVGINEKTMMYIVENPERYAGEIGEYTTEICDDFHI